MTFIEFIRSKGFTTKSLAEESGVSARTLEAYTRSQNRYKWENTGLGLINRLACVLEIMPEDFLQFDDAEPEPKKEEKWKKYSSYNSAYQAKRRKTEPEKWSIIKRCVRNGYSWYLVQNDSLSEWKREFLGGK